MADVDVVNEGAGAEPEQAGADVGRRSPIAGAGGLLVKILKWVILLLGLLIFVVTVVVVTVMYLNARTTPTELPPDVSGIYTTGVPEYDYYALEEVRTRNIDDPPIQLVVVMQIGYAKGDEVMHTELINRTIELYDKSRYFFSTKTRSELLPGNEASLKDELKELLNLVVASGRIEEIAFTDYNIYE